MRRIARFLELVCLLMAFASTAAHSDEIEVREAELRPSEEGFVLSADFAFELGTRLSEALANGIPLYFVIEFELTRARWYWFDEKTLAKRMQVRVSYHPLSRQFRLSTGPLQQSFPTLEEALGVLRRLRNWQVAERSTLAPETDYEAAVRMRLDRALLPKPFQLSAITNSEWHLESGWKKFPFRTGPAVAAPVESREPRRVEEPRPRTEGR